MSAEKLELEKRSQKGYEGPARRLIRPLCWNPASNKFIPSLWRSAFEEIGRETNSLNGRVVYPSRDGLQAAAE